MTFFSRLACFLAHSGARTEIFRSSAMPESRMLVALGGGLLILASVVRRFFPAGDIVVPKSMQLVVWISPKEVVEHLSAREDR